MCYDSRKDINATDVRLLWLRLLYSYTLPLPQPQPCLTNRFGPLFHSFCFGLQHIASLGLCDGFFDVVPRVVETRARRTRITYKHRQSHTCSRPAFSPENAACVTAHLSASPLKSFDRMAFRLQSLRNGRLVQDFAFYDFDALDTIR